MKLCIPMLIGLSDEELMDIATGRVDAQECEVEGAAYLLIKRQERRARDEGVEAD